MQRISEFFNTQLELKKRIIELQSDPKNTYEVRSTVAHGSYHNETNSFESGKWELVYFKLNGWDKFKALITEERYSVLHLMFFAVLFAVFDVLLKSLGWD